jgi:hypothetical protein
MSGEREEEGEAEGEIGRASVRKCVRTFAKDTMCTGAI